MEPITMLTIALVGTGGALLARDVHNTKRIKSLESQLADTNTDVQQKEEEIEQIVSRINS